MNTDETTILNKFGPRGVVIGKKTKAKRRPELVADSYAGFSLVAHQTSSKLFFPSPSLILGSSAPTMKTKQKIGLNARKVYPDIGIYDGNEDGNHCMDTPIWQKIVDQMITEKKAADKQHGEFAVIWVVDEHRSHTFDDDRENNLAAVGIYPIVLGPSTTSFQQVLDCQGFFRSLKALLKAGITDCGQQLWEDTDEWKAADYGMHLALEVFWKEYEKLTKRYSGIESFHRCGLSIECYAARKQRKVVTPLGIVSRAKNALSRELCTSFPRMFSKIRQLKFSASLQSNTVDVSEIELQPLSTGLTHRQKTLEARRSATAPATFHVDSDMESIITEGNNASSGVDSDSERF
jgi:hypothetical protein